MSSLLSLNEDAGGIYANLDADLECKDAAASLKNRARLGHSTPRQEFVESMKPIDLMALGHKWMIGGAVLRKIAKKDDWLGQRARFLRSVRDLERRLVSGDIADLKIKEASKNMDLWEALRDVFISVASRGHTVEMNAIGEEWKRPYDARAFLDLTKAAEVISKNMGETLRVISGEDEAEKDAKIPNIITEIVYNVSVPSADQIPEPKQMETTTYEALPEGTE